ncbi:MAG: hypothetical protein KAR24_02660 [Candidatus Pacebacteria bacterium]|nr:hypothetical protein [Candidatus Paceibacterota bacterium]
MNDSNDSTKLDDLTKLTIVTGINLRKKNIEKAKKLLQKIKENPTVRKIEELERILSEFRIKYEDIGIDDEKMEKLTFVSYLFDSLELVKKISERVAPYALASSLHLVRPITPVRREIEEFLLKKFHIKEKEISTLLSLTKKEETVARAKELKEKAIEAAEIARFL